MTSPSPSPDAALPEPSSSPPRPLFYSSLKKAHQRRTVPELREEDLEESFVRGRASNLFF